MKLENELDFVIGGAKIDKTTQGKFKRTFNSQMCNCGLFESSFTKCSVNICDNCLWSRAPEENTTVTYHTYTFYSS